MIETCVLLPGFQNRFEPQLAQNPRSAAAEERYQRRLSERVSDSCGTAQAVAATKWPLARRHILQWQ